jgi:hypothetical protein
VAKTFLLITVYKTDHTDKADLKKMCIGIGNNRDRVSKG